ncbi:hypothetical protein XELAEV_18014817mg [Xenopus laevis]|uniref:Uncharacterized protein n=1 Tax=Xenopus laevis TaxID=8355 RepID=A0A974DJH1_XENLA|nr:hypothetical protein XELAEV_18014817mg [Xenopus laevis]
MSSIVQLLISGFHGDRKDLGAPCAQLPAMRVLSPCAWALTPALFQISSFTSKFAPISFSSSRQFLYSWEPKFSYRIPCLGIQYISDVSASSPYLSLEAAVRDLRTASKRRDWAKKVPVLRGSSHRLKR